MTDEDPTPTSDDVVRYLNSRFSELGLSFRVEHLAVLPYMNPRWMANWDIPPVTNEAEREVIEKELIEARWIFPQIRDVL